MPSRLSDSMVLTYFLDGNFATGTDLARWVLPFDAKILSVVAKARTAPTGATTAKVDVNVDGTTIYTTQTARPIFADGATSATVGAHAVDEVPAGSVISLDIDAVGNTTPGVDLSVTVHVEPA